jgi:predicted acylesterase/phospholipase RssA
MIDEYVNKLIENLPEETKKLQNIDLILDGGLFNGSYLVGALYFLKEMERRKYMNVDRISGCSIGSLVGFLYYIDSLDLMPILYELVKQEFKKKYTLNVIKSLKLHLLGRIPKDICLKINNKLFICYNNIKTHKKIVKCTYKNVDDIIDTIVKSCYIPFLIDNNMLYKKKYIDGINAFIFKKQINKKILHMELFGYDKFASALNIKNEKTNFHRILSGLLDIHSFFIKKTSTPMCSFVEDWNVLNNCNYRIKILFESILVYSIYIMMYSKKLFPKEFHTNIIVTLMSKITFDIFSTLLETYCL